MQVIKKEINNNRNSQNVLFVKNYLYHIHGNKKLTILWEMFVENFGRILRMAILVQSVTVIGEVHELMN